MILVADSGSSKTHWVYVGQDDKRISFQTIGLNPFNTPIEEIFSIINSEIDIPKEFSSEIYFYGAGCSSKSKKLEMENVFKDVFPNSNIEINHDMLGAARALCGRDKGICGILGTGSNSCVFNGVEITENIPALGYVLCDEGGGTDIGKRVLSSYLKGLMPKDISDKFYAQFPFEESYFLDKIYKETRPNYFLASFARFAIENKEEKYLREILKKSFKSFFENQILLYPNYNKYSLNFVGSVAYLCEDILRESSRDFGLSISKIIQSPINHLVDFHLNKI